MKAPMAIRIFIGSLFSCVCAGATMGGLYAFGGVQPSSEAGIAFIALWALCMFFYFSIDEMWK